MNESPLSGRRIHIAGSILHDSSIATTDQVQKARELVRTLTGELVKRGATFVIPVDAETIRQADGEPICFDWLVWQAVNDNLTMRPANSPNPVVVAVQHHKNEEQIPPEYVELWDRMRNSNLVQIENVSHWNMASKRMEAQARYGEILIAIGGSEGVLFLANLYHAAGKPVIPLNNPVTGAVDGARKLFTTVGLSSDHAQRLFRARDLSAHAWINRINFPNRRPTVERVDAILSLLEDLNPPEAFVVRLLNPDHADFPDVQAYFDTVVQPIIEGELGYRLVVVDGHQPFEHARVDQEIFAKLHRSSLVLADITALRPNCLIELGYALGRGARTMLLAKKGTDHPFDVTTLSALHWQPEEPSEVKRLQFREHWRAIKDRPPLVSSEPLIP
jgi:hypothetical protein